MSPLPDAFLRKQLYIQHLAERLHAMDQAQEPMNAVCYRLYARRLREAAAGFPAPKLAVLTDFHPVVIDALDDAFFGQHGQLPGVEAARACRVAHQLLNALAAAR